MLSECRAGDNSFPLSLGGLSNARLVGNWASAKLQASHKTKLLQLGTVLHSEAQSNWSVIDTGPCCSTPGGFPKEKQTGHFH